MNNEEIRKKEEIESALAAITGGDFLQTSKNLLEVLDYHSPLIEEFPRTADNFIQEYPAEKTDTKTEQEFRKSAKSVGLVSQVGSDELADSQPNHFESRTFDKGLIKSFVFCTVELKDKDYSRSRYAEFTREINKRTTLATVVFFRVKNRLTIGFVGRRPSQLDESKDVLEKATMIKDIRLDNPHRAHLDILFELSLDECEKWMDAKNQPKNFDGLLEAWLARLGTEELNKKFYKELFAWFKWAVKDATFPTNENRTLDPEEHVIRLITRLLFVWFIKEKGLVSDELFNEEQVRDLLKDCDRDCGDSYYRAVLQNLFFATLNTEIEKRGFSEGGNPRHRNFSLCRYKDQITDPNTLLGLFEKTPFINGGLFDCLDSEEATREGGYRIDCFSDVHYNKLRVPNRLFFDDDRGLIPLLERYKFTVEENTPIEQDVALDPELLGKVFENLLAAYNPETAATVRKQTGAYYTPRTIVDYMVDEALVATLAGQVQPTESDAELWEDQLRYLLDYAQVCDDASEWFNDDETGRIVRAISELKILDPAVGSGAFPMGALHKLTLALRRLDPDNRRWEQLQRDRAGQRVGEAFDEKDDQTRREKLLEIDETFKRYRDSDFGRKLYLIQNSIFGVDIQPVACQIAKLRFFISLAIEQEPNMEADNNFGIKPLPNLETRFIAANTLIGLKDPQILMSEQLTRDLEEELHDNSERHFHATTRSQKRAYEKKDKALRKELATTLRHLGMPADDAGKIAHWDLYDQNASADWFDAGRMFDVRNGFDVVIGNPPYKQVKKGVHSSQLFPYSEGKDKGKQNFYKLFVEHSYNLCKQNGLATLIVQSSLMCDLSSAATRQLLLEHTQLKHIIEFPKTAQSPEVQVFSAVTQGTCIYQFTKSLPNDEPIKISVGNDAHSIADLKFSIITKEAIMNWYPELRYFPYIREGSVPILEKIADDETTNPLKHYIADISQGDFNLATHSSQFSQRPSAVRLLRGKHVNRFVVKYDEADEYCAEGFMVDKVAANRNNTFLISQEVTGTVDPRRLHFALTENPPVNILWGHSVNKTLLKNQKDSAAFLALLNSKFMDWYFRITSTNNHVQGYELEQLPIPAMSDADREELNNLAGQVMEAKRLHLGTDVSDLENKIDQIVYLLYSLTDEEIAIVEGAATV